MWIGSLTRPVTLPLRGALAINLIHVGGEGDNDCSNVVKIFAIKEKKVESCSSDISICTFKMYF